MAHAASLWSACLLGLVAFACAPRAEVKLAAPPPAPLPEGQESLENLDRALRNGEPVLVATLQRSERIADKSTAVKVSVVGLGLVDPHLVREEAQMGQGHVHYQVDDGPVIATVATKLYFQNLAPGRHTIVVSLAGNDHRPLGPKRILTLNVPGDDKPSRTRKRSSTKKKPPAVTDKAASLSAR